MAVPRKTPPWAEQLILPCCFAWRLSELSKAYDCNHAMRYAPVGSLQAWELDIKRVGCCDELLENDLCVAKAPVAVPRKIPPTTEQLILPSSFAWRLSGLNQGNC